MAQPVTPTSSASNFELQAFLNLSVSYLPWLWCVGTPLTFLLLATGLVGAERLRSSCQLLEGGPIRTACDELRTALGIGQQVGVAVCERIATPLLVGVVKPLILLPPAALTGWTTAELEMVLVHELAHVRRWDNAVNLGQRIVESLLFFHPAVWLVSGWVRRDREDCCDAAVVRHTAKPQAYAELLLALASHTPGLAASAAMAQHPVASRIRRILKLEDEPMLVTRKGLFVGVSAIVVAALLVFALPTTDAEETVSRESERVADERAAVETTTNPTNDTNQEKESTTEDTETTEEETVTRETQVEVPGDAKDLASVKESLRKQGYGSRFEKVVTEDGRYVNIVWVTLPKDTKHRVVFEEHPDGLRARVLLYDKSGKIINEPLDEPALNGQTYAAAVETTTNPTNDTNQEENSSGGLALRATGINFPAELDDAECKRIVEFLKSQGHDASLQKSKLPDGSPLNVLMVKIPKELQGKIVWEEHPEGLRARVILFDKSGKAIDGALGENAENTKEDLNAESAKSAEDAKNPLFPTLEEQRAADLAYKLLGVELEKLTPDELVRVKAIGYKGGVKVGPNSALGLGDLLVGLHVWPTESLDQVTEILNRDDLDQLSPLKFYVVRSTDPHSALPQPDEVVTGRIQVDLDAWRAMREPPLKQLVALEKQIQDELAEKKVFEMPVPPESEQCLTQKSLSYAKSWNKLGKK